MKIFKFFQYAYLLFGAIFIFDAFRNYQQNGEIPYLSLLLAALAIFMFFFRRRFFKRYENDKDRNS